MIGLFAAAVRDPDPVIVVEPKVLYATKGEVPDGEIVDELGTARVLRAGDDVTICALGAMVPKALDAAERLAADGVSAEVIDVRSLVPLDVTTILESVGRTSRLVTVEENPRLCGWGAEVASIVADEGFFGAGRPHRAGHDAACAAARRRRARRPGDPLGGPHRGGCPPRRAMT